jgi:hypothetical protein
MRHTSTAKKATQFSSSLVHGKVVEFELFDTDR